MSTQNVETIRRCFELVVKGDVDSLEDLVFEDTELRSAVAGSTGSVYRGARGMHKYLADLAEAWERFAQVPEEFIHLDDKGALVIVRVDARGRTSGVELTQRLAVHWSFRDGKPWRGVGYSDVSEARRAVGLT